MLICNPICPFVTNVQITRDAIRSRCLIIIALLFISACGEKDLLNAAPLGDTATLEKLAEAYRAESNNLPATPTALTPAGRRDFLNRLFKTAGFSYSKTLIKLAEIEKNTITKNHRDLKQLLYLPHYDKRIDDLTKIYSQQEIVAINKIDINFK